MSKTHGIRGINYSGDLYGKIGRKYFKLNQDTSYVEQLEEHLNETKASLIEAVEWIQEIKGYVPNAKQADKFYIQRLDEWLERTK